jgi:predicted unusual protein kinase regulating ubiquinone biosynthesis (AarF/ABC1/UbiB family)
MLQQFWFIINISWIFLSEIGLYCIFWNKIQLLERLSMRLAKANVLYVKVFQAFAVKAFGENITPALLKFTDEAPWTADDVDQVSLDQLVQEYNIDMNKCPIKSGMISLVYKGQMNGSPVAIKIQRKNILIKLNNGIDNLRFFAVLISWIPFFKKFNLVDTVNKNTYLILEQTCFVKEVANLNQMKGICKYLKYVQIPNVFAEVTEKYSNIIMMEYIDGQPIEQIDTCDRVEFAKQVIKFGIATSLVHGVTHGDLHRGNILFIKTNDIKIKYKLGILDFGIVNTIDASFRNNILDIVCGLFTTSAEESAKKILLSGIVEPVEIIKELPKEHYDTIVQFISTIIQSMIFKTRQVNQVEIYNLFRDINIYLVEHVNLGLKPCDGFVKLQLTIAMAHGVTMSLCGENYSGLLNEVLAEMFQSNLLET